jgi:hypothetical protein
MLLLHPHARTVYGAMLAVRAAALAMTNLDKQGRRLRTAILRIPAK